MLIHFQGVSINVEDRKVLEDIHFKVDNSEFVYIIGRVGSGKSSLLKTIYAELGVKGGTAQVTDFDLHKIRTRDVPTLRRKLGMVFQDFALLPTYTIEGNLDFVLRATDWKKKNERQKRIDEVLKQVGMTEKSQSYPHQLSGGEQQRIAIARALLNNPEILLADEPTGNLDAETGHSIVQLLRSLTTMGTAVVMVTHNEKYLVHYPGIVYRCDNKQLHDVTQEYRNVTET